MSRIPLQEAEVLLSQFLESVSTLTKRTSPLGSVRRKKADIGDIDVLVEISSRDLGFFKRKVWENSRIYSGKDKKLRLSNFMGSDREADVWIVYPPRNFYVLQAFFTGEGHSQLLREKLLEKGYHRPHATLAVSSEEEVFALAGLPYLPPEERLFSNV